MTYILSCNATRHDMMLAKSTRVCVLRKSANKKEKQAPASPRERSVENTPREQRSRRIRTGKVYEFINIFQYFLNSLLLIYQISIREYTILIACERYQNPLMHLKYYTKKEERDTKIAIIDHTT